MVCSAYFETHKGNKFKVWCYFSRCVFCSIPPFPAVEKPQRIQAYTRFAKSWPGFEGKTSDYVSVFQEQRHMQGMKSLAILIGWAGRTRDFWFSTLGAPRGLHKRQMRMSWSYFVWWVCARGKCQIEKSTCVVGILETSLFPNHGRVTNQRLCYYVLHKSWCKNGWCSTSLIFKSCRQSCRAHFFSPGICNYWMTLQTSRHALSVFILWGLVGWFIATSDMETRNIYEHLAGDLTGPTRTSMFLQNPRISDQELCLSGQGSFFSPECQGNPRGQHKERGNGFERPNDRGILVF